MLLLPMLHLLRHRYRMLVAFLMLLGRLGCSLLRRPRLLLLLQLQLLLHLWLSLWLVPWGRLPRPPLGHQHLVDALQV